MGTAFAFPRLSLLEDAGMKAMPVDRALDNTLALFADPYGFISSRARRFDSDVFETRLLMRPTLCMTGAAAAELFYDPGRFQRAGAAPEPLRATLFGKRAVQTLDGPAHRARKALFMEALSPPRVAALARGVGVAWQEAATRWPAAADTQLYPAAQEVLTRAVCAWAGVPLAEADAPRRTAELAALYDDAARGVSAHLHSRRCRHRAEAWLRGEIDRVRAKSSPPAAARPHAWPASRANGAARPADAGTAGGASALHAVALHRDEQGRLLPARTAAVELLNILRPTVAVSVFIVFAAHALLFHPELRRPLINGDRAYRERFINEVRRYYPFFPAVMAVVREDFEWKGYLFRRGRRTLLDLYGTNHDARLWKEPSAFNPDRFIDRPPTPFDFIPQGGGQAQTGHRCPGEGVAMAAIDATLDFLLTQAHCTAAPHDERIDMRRLPALPRAAMLVRRAAAPA